MTVTRFVLNLIVVHNGRFTFKSKSQEFMTSLTEHRIDFVNALSMHIFLRGDYMFQL